MPGNRLATAVAMNKRPSNRRLKRRAYGRRWIRELSFLFAAAGGRSFTAIR